MKPPLRAIATDFPKERCRIRQGDYTSQCVLTHGDENLGKSESSSCY